MTPADPFSSHWDDLPLPNILSLLNTEKKTGKLTVESTAASRDLLFVDGELRAARSSSENEKLGSWLVSQRVISEARKQGALLIQEGSDAPPLGHMLVAKGVIDTESLENHLELLAVTILERATAEDRRRCSFEDGLADGQLDTLPNLSTPQLILIAGRALPGSDSQRQALGDLEQMVTRNGPLDAIVQEFSLTVPESVFLGKLHRAQTLSRLKAISGLDDAVFFSTAYCLKITGLLSLSARPRRQASVQAQTTTTMSQKTGVLAIKKNAKNDRTEILRLSANVKNMNYYDFFNIKPQASYQEIFDAWDVYRQRFDPARSSEAHLSDLEKELQIVYEYAEEAYEKLSSPVDRPRYDRMLRTAAETGTASKSTFFPGSTAPQRARESLVSENLKQADRLIRTGDNFSAVKLLEQVCDLDPQPAHLLKLAKLMLLNPRWANRALEKLRRAVEIDPTFVDGWLAVAEYWRGQKNKERERKALEQALGAFPGHGEAATLYRSLVGGPELSRFLDRVRRSLSPPEDQ
ncbi:MAG: DUF4388 domain-containing protein [Acidobacteriota bacterium]